LNGDNYFLLYACRLKKLNFLCIAKTEKLRLNEVEGILAKNPEKIW